VISFITTRENAGHNSYVRTAQMMLVKAVRDVLKEQGNTVRVKIEFALGNAFYCSVHEGVRVTDDFALRVENEMKRLRDKNLPIVKKTYPDRLLNVLSYAPTVAAPSAVHPVESNVEIMFCTETSMTKPTAEAGYIGLPGWKQQIPWKTNMQNYIARTNVKHVAVWKWLCIAANSYSGDWGKMPWVQGNVATEDHAFWKSMGATYVFYDQGPHTAYREYDNSFPLRWPLWYVANRGCWTQDKTGEQLLRDACEKLYGKGADAMLAYYMALADASEACTVESYAWIPCAPSDVFTPAQVKIIDARIAEAKKMLDSVTEVQAKRMENQIKLWEKAKTYL
jgi:hypothetical protein